MGSRCGFDTIVRTSPRARRVVPPSESPVEASYDPAVNSGEDADETGIVIVYALVWRRSSNSAVMRDLPMPGSPEISTT